MESETPNAARSAKEIANSRIAEKRAAAARRAKKKQRERIILLSLCGVAAAILIGVIILLAVMFSKTPDEVPTIQANIYAAGVSLRGKTEQEAKAALLEATEDTYDSLSMTIHLLDETITLSPEDTGARLDVDKVVAAAMEYSSNNKNQTAAYNLSIVSYLNLDTEYISGVLSDLGNRYSTTLKQTTYEILGEKPSMEQEEYDTETPFQTLYIYMGTAEYGLNTDALYQQILDAYEINLFEVNCECSVLAPEALDYEAIYSALCSAPVNAEMNPDTYEITEEIYGYGFTLEALKTAVETASYGDTIELGLYFLKPDITYDFYSQDMFQDTLASFSTPMPTEAALKKNLDVVCQMLNGTMIKAGETFSFNEMTGLPHSDQGFVPASVYLGKSYQEIVGGGISQAASTLYYCALLADLTITDRTCHSYTVDYIQAGFDAQVYHGSMDLQFVNSTAFPIRIEASISGGNFNVAIIGTATNEYTVELTYKIDETFTPSTVTNTMLPNNAGGYKEGDVLSTGITGYVISTYAMKYSVETGELVEEMQIAESYYAKRDEVIVQIYVEPVIPTEPDPTDPTETEPDVSETLPGVTEEPSEAPSEEPSEAPTDEPTEAPTEEPTEAPTEEPTEEPTEALTEADPNE